MSTDQESWSPVFPDDIPEETNKYRLLELHSKDAIKIREDAAVQFLKWAVEAPAIIRGSE